jgi:hypothetical protein
LTIEIGDCRLGPQSTSGTHDRQSTLTICNRQSNRAAITNPQSTISELT